MANFTRLTETRTSAPTLSSLSRIVPQAASANWVCGSPMRRSAHISTYAIEANHSLSWFARMVAAEVRSANRSPCVSLMRFSISALANHGRVVIDHVFGGLDTLHEPVEGGHLQEPCRDGWARVGSARLKARSVA